MSDADDGFTGTVTLRHGDDVVRVAGTLRGGVDTISGRYHWYGRVASDPALDALVGQIGPRATVVLGTPEGEAETLLTDRDPWGRLRVEGWGHAPFEVLIDVPAEGPA